MEAYFGSIPLWINISLFAVGIAIIAKGADVFINSSVVVAEITGIPKIIIGATIVSLLTTFPEFSVSFIATLLGKTQTAVGNALGSVICNAGLVMGSCVLIKSMHTNRKMVLSHGSFLVFAALLMFVISFGGSIDRWGGILLLCVMMGYGALLVYEIKKGILAKPEAIIGDFEDTIGIEKASADRQRIKKSIVTLLIGGIAVGGGSMLLVQNGTSIARAMGVSELIIALTFTAIGTSLPEYVTAIKACMKGHTELSVGNIIGANIIDILMINGVCALVRPLPILPQTRFLDIPCMVVLMVLFVVFSLTHKKILRWEGSILLLLYVVYVIILFTKPFSFIGE